MCNKITDEDLSHIFETSIGTRACFDFIRDSFLIDKSLVLSLDLMQYKNNVDKNDYFYISNIVYAIWITRYIVKKQKKMFVKLSPSLWEFSTSGLLACQRSKQVK